MENLTTPVVNIPSSKWILFFTKKKAFIKDIIFGFLIGGVVSCFLIQASMAFQEPIGRMICLLTPLEIPANIENMTRTNRQLKSRIASLRIKRDSKIPQVPYLIVDTSGNQFQLMRGKRILYHSVCSTGSYLILKKNNKEIWIFQTPRGMFRVQNVIPDPVWRMPDWAFIEEGLPVPPHDAAERFETGVLGEYAFDLGEGYLIHGTLYQRFLGMPVTHGCIRLGDEEIETIYRNLQVGSKVFIY